MKQYALEAATPQEAPVNATIDLTPYKVFVLKNPAHGSVRLSLVPRSSGFTLSSSLQNHSDPRSSSSSCLLLHRHSELLSITLQPPPPLQLSVETLSARRLCSCRTICGHLLLISPPRHHQPEAVSFYQLPGSVEQEAGSSWHQLLPGTLDPPRGQIKRTVAVRAPG